MSIHRMNNGVLRTLPSGALPAGTVEYLSASRRATRAAAQDLVGASFAAAQPPAWRRYLKPVAAGAAVLLGGVVLARNLK